LTVRSAGVGEMIAAVPEKFVILTGNEKPSQRPPFSIVYRWHATEKANISGDGKVACCDAE